MYVCALNVKTKLYFCIYATLVQFHKLQICFVFLSRNCSSAICRRWGGSDLSHPRWYPWLLHLQWPIPPAGGGTVCVSDWSTCHAAILVAGFSLVQIWLRQCQKHVESYPEEQSSQDTLCEFGWLGHLWVVLCLFCLLTLSLPAILFCVPYHYITCIGCPKTHFLPWNCDLLVSPKTTQRHFFSTLHPLQKRRGWIYVVISDNARSWPQTHSCLTIRGHTVLECCLLSWESHHMR